MECTYRDTHDSTKRREVVVQGDNLHITQLITISQSNHHHHRHENNNNNFSYNYNHYYRFTYV